LNHKNHKEQFERYRKQFDNLIITDYIWFQFFQKGQLVHELRIASIENKKIKPITANFSEFSDLMTNFCTYISQSIKSPKELAKMMANRARLLQKEIEKTLIAEALDDSQPKSTLQGEYENFKHVLIHDLDIKSFSDIYSQTLAYGMFTARLHDESLDTFNRQEAAGLIPKSNPFLRTLFDRIAGIDIDDSIVTTVDNLAEVFRATDIKEVLKNFGRATHTQDPIIHFYETFLSEYDPALRKARGVWYTPEPIVNFIVRGVDEILKTEFGFSKGLADNSKTTINVEVQGATVSKGRNKGKPLFQDKEVHKVQVLDPATGTGTFLAEVFRHIYKGEFRNKKGAWGGYVKKHLIPRLNGFEILMASYAMAHLKLDMLMRDTGVELSDNQRFNIFLTNSLEEYDDKTGTLFASALSKESNAADFVKRDTPVMVVMGNPPYSVSSSNKSDWIQELLLDYKKDLNERNIQPLSDDYIKFIRYGQRLIDKNGEGILAYISNNSFIDGVIHRQMRKSLMESFDKIYILDLHGSTKRKEKSPDGSKDDNVFDIQQGVSINFFIKTNASKKGQSQKLFKHDLFGTRQSKYDYLSSNSLSSVKWLSLAELDQQLSFKPYKPSALNEQNSFQPHDLFKTAASGITTERDSVCMQFEETALEEVLYDFLHLEEGLVRQKYSIDKDGRDWKVSTAKQDLLSNPHKMVEVLYRPFDKRFSSYSGKSKGFHAYPRSVVSSHLLEENYALIIGRQGQAMGDGEWNIIHITNTLVDCNIYYRGRGTVFPLYLYPEEGKQQNLGKSRKRKPNLDAETVEVLAKDLGLVFESEKSGEEGKFAPIDLLDYIYAVLHSPTYRETYKEFLKIDFPRIPYPKNAAKFWQLVKLGGELRQIHLLESPVLDDHDINYPKSGSDKVTRKITKNSIGYESTSDTHGKVWINDKQYFENVPLIAWEFHIGGYQPAQKWLKDRSKEEIYIGDDIDHYRHIIVALTETHRIMQKIDTVIGAS